MRSVTSFFNKAIFIKNMKRFWPIWTLYLIAYTIGLPVAIASAAQRPVTLISVPQYILNNALYMGTIMSFIFGIISALAVFSYLFTARSVGAYHTFPIRREGLFVTNYLSGMVWLLLSNVFIFLLTLITTSLYGIPQLTVLLQWLLMLTLQCIFFFGFGVFCVMLTGGGFSLVVIYGILNFAAVTLEMLFRYCVSEFTYGISVNGSAIFGVLSPVFEIFSETHVKSIGTAPFRSFYYTGWNTMIIYGAAGLLLAVAALFIYKRRHSESASEFIAIPSLRPVFKYFFAFLGSTLLGSLFYSVIFGLSRHNASIGAPGPMIFCMALGGFFGYYITAMLLKKSFRVFKTTSFGFLAYTFALIALLMAFEFDIPGVEKYTPLADQVVSLKFNANGVSDEIEDKEVINRLVDVQKSLISNKPIYENYVRNNGTNFDYTDSLSVNYSYKLKNGRVIMRQYMLYKAVESNNAIISNLENVLNSKEAIRDRMEETLSLTPNLVSSIAFNYKDEHSNYKSIYLNQQIIPDFLINCLQADILEGNLGRVSLVYGNNPSAYTGDCEIVLYLPENRNMVLYPNLSSKKTLAYLKELGINPIFGDNPKYSGMTMAKEF